MRAVGLYPLVGPRRLLLGAGFGPVHQLHVAVVLHSVHKNICHADRNVEIFELSLVLGSDELLHVRVVAAHHAHLRAPPRTGRLDGLAGAVEHLHVAHRPGGVALGALDPGPARADARKVVTYATALAHGLRCLRQCHIDAGVAIFELGN